MQLLQAGSHQLVLLELDADLLRQGAEESGFLCHVKELERSTVLELNAKDREGPLLLFDASDPSNTGWFSRCQFYVDGRNGSVLQTPFILANRLDAQGRPLPRSIDLQINRELPANFQLPGRQPVTEKVLYGVLFNFLSALQKVGVGLCGPMVVKPLAGRVDAPAR